MQDKTINNALLALRRQGVGLDHVEALLALRGVLPPPRPYQVSPSKRGEASKKVLDALRSGPATAPDLAGLFQCGSITRRTAINRAYQALLRLEVKGMVRREGRAWFCLMQASSAKFSRLGEFF